MTGVVASLFTTGIELVGPSRMLMLLPLCLSIAVVYKATRCGRLREIPVEAATLFVTIVIGMYAVGVGLWALFHIMV